MLGRIGNAQQNIDDQNIEERICILSVIQQNLVGVDCGAKGVSTFHAWFARWNIWQVLADTSGGKAGCYHQPKMFQQLYASLSNPS